MLGLERPTWKREAEPFRLRLPILREIYE